MIAVEIGGVRAGIWGKRNESILLSAVSAAPGWGWGLKENARSIPGRAHGCPEQVQPAWKPQAAEPASNRLKRLGSSRQKAQGLELDKAVFSSQLWHELAV